MRSHSGKRGRGDTSAGFNAAILLLFQLIPKTSQLIRTEIGKDFTVDIDNRRKLLTGKPNHFIISGFIRNHIDGFVINLMLVQPALSFIAPAAIWLHE